MNFVLIATNQDVDENLAALITPEALANGRYSTKVICPLPLTGNFFVELTHYYCSFCHYHYYL